MQLASLATTANQPTERQQFVLDQGYPALMLTDTSFLRNPNYHQATDTPDTLDYQRMTAVTLGVASLT